MKGEIKKGLSTSLENRIWSNSVVLFYVCGWAGVLTWSALAALLLCTVVHPTSG